MNTNENNTAVIENEGVDTSNTNSTNEQQFFTREEMLAFAQSEADKRVTAALRTQQKKFDKQLSLSKLDDSEREKAEKDDLIAELREQLAQMNTERNRSDLKSVLSSRGLSAEFADIIVINDDIETSQANIDKLDKLFKAAVKAEVEKRLAGTAPKGNATYINTGDVTQEQFKQMSLSQQAALASSNPELYKRLSQR